MLKRSHSPKNFNISNESEVESPFYKQIKVNKQDGPSKNYCEYINNQMKEEPESDNDSSSILQMKEEDINIAFDKAQKALLSFMQLTQKTKEKNYFSTKELKSKFKVSFTVLPSSEEVMNIFAKVLKRITQQKTQRRNWYQEDTMLLLWVIKRYSSFKNKHYDSLNDEDWKFISEMIPVKTQDQCKFKFLTLKKVDLYKFPWSKEEDKFLKQIMSEKSSFKFKWGDVAKDLNKLTHSAIFRSGKLCRERWNNYLDPDIKKCEWSSEEDTSLLNLVLSIGKKWSEISKFLPGRNENSVKNRFFALLRKERKARKAEKMQIDDFGDISEDFQNEDAEIILINKIINENKNKMENESSVSEIKLKNLTSSLKNVKITTISRIPPSENMDRLEKPESIPKPQDFNIHLKKEELKEEPKIPSPPLISNPTNSSLRIPSSLGLGLSRSDFNLNLQSPSFTSPQSKGNPFMPGPGVFFQPLPKMMPINPFNMLNPYAFAPPQMSFDPFKFACRSGPDLEKAESLLHNHPFYNSGNGYNQTPQTLKNNEALRRDSNSFSTHPLVQRQTYNEIMEISNSNNSSNDLDNVMMKGDNIPVNTQSKSFQHLPEPGNFKDLTMNIKIRDGMELNPADYSQCLYSVVNLAKKELYLFTPLSNASESNKSFLSAMFNVGGGHSSLGSNNNHEEFSNTGGTKSLTKMQCESFRMIKKNNTFHSLSGSQKSSNNLSKDRVEEGNINQSILTNSPPHSPRKDSKFKENYLFPINFSNEFGGP